MYKAPRGTSDQLPSEQKYWSYIQDVIASVCMAYGFDRINTPIFESTALFVRTVGEQTDVVQKEMYTFDDRGGESLTLRPEGTAPVCRAYLEHGMHVLPHCVTSWNVPRIENAPCMPCGSRKPVMPLA